MLKLPLASVFVDAFPETTTGTLATACPFAPTTFPVTVTTDPAPPPEGPVELLLLHPPPTSTVRASARADPPVENIRFSMHFLLHN